jgi:hypothetical protein
MGAADISCNIWLYQMHQQGGIGSASISMVVVVVVVSRGGFPHQVKVRMYGILLNQMNVGNYKQFWGCFQCICLAYMQLSNEN